VVEAFSARVKDIANVGGNSEVQVIGYGLVVGLNQTGDNIQANSYTNQSVINMLKRFGLTLNSQNVRMRNVAAVMVTATVPNFVKSGGKTDVVVSSMGDANSLQGGTLLLTPLLTQDGRIVGNAQGPVTVGGYDYRSLGSQVSKNFVTSGRVPNGLILSRDIGGELTQDEKIRISLKDPDFTAVTDLASLINNDNNIGLEAEAIDASTVELALAGGESSTEIMTIISQVENLNLDIQPEARVIINERTGTIVIGGNVTILPAVISHGGLEIAIQRQVLVPQPAPFTILPPRIAQSADIEVEEEINTANPIDVDETATVEDISNALNLLEIKPRDLIAIFQALKESGSLQAELIIQ
jgi:flagellar P-ring protein precursor FlgI